MDIQTLPPNVRCFLMSPASEAEGDHESALLAVSLACSLKVVYDVPANGLALFDLNGQLAFGET
jgi:hypothetical protein